MTGSADHALGSLGRYHRVVSSRIPEADVVSEARFVMAASDERGLGLRLLEAWPSTCTQSQAAIPRLAARTRTLTWRYRGVRSARSGACLWSSRH